MIQKLVDRLRRHRCTPPTGVVFHASWTCATCGTGWTLVERANHSVWLRV